MKVSHKTDGNSEPNSVFIGLTYEEAFILKIYVEYAIAEMLKANVWGPD
jgi:hypothetical protein